MFSWNIHRVLYTESYLFMLIWKLNFNEKYQVVSFSYNAYMINGSTFDIHIQ